PPPPPPATRISEEVAATLGADPGVTIDYVEVLDPETLTPPDAARTARGQAGDGAPEARQLLVAVAASVGPVRLIDNVVVGDPEDEERLLAATN
ncbi:MAG: pantoate--beta-alanine ligase, partial [Nitriliruptor sp.]